MKLCILHCGHPKSGTSSLQRFLATNSDRLLAHGVYYPVLRPPGREAPPLPWIGFQHGGPLKAMSNPKRPQTGLQRLDRLLDRTPHEVLVLSAEFLMKALFYRKSSTVPDYLAARGYRIETISYLRDQPDRLNSAYAQQCKTAHYGESFDRFCQIETGVAEAGGEAEDDADEPMRMFYDPLVAEGAHGWGRHMFRPFAAEVKRIGVEADFMLALREVLGRAGLAPGLTAEAAAEFEVPARVNESDGVLLVAVNRKLAGRIARKFDLKQNPDDLCRAAYLAGSAAIRDLGYSDRKYSALTPERVARLRALFRPGNDLVAAKLWGSTWAEVFPEPDPARLVSTDLDESDDPVLKEQYVQVLRKTRRDFKAAEDQFRDARRGAGD